MELLYVEKHFGYFVFDLPQQGHHIAHRHFHTHSCAVRGWMPCHGWELGGTEGEGRRAPRRPPSVAASERMDEEEGTWKRAKSAWPSFPYYVRAAAMAKEGKEDAGWRWRWRGGTRIHCTITYQRTGTLNRESLRFGRPLLYRTDKRKGALRY